MADALLRICFDQPGAADLRNRLRAAHRAYLVPFNAAGSATRLVQAGPICVGDADDTNLGSFMIIEAASLASAQALHDGDPFTIGGLFDRSFVHRCDKYIE